MNLSLYLDRRTWIHQLDGRTKVLCLFGLFCLALLFSDPWYLLGLTALAFGGILTARVLKNVKKLWALLALLFVYSMALWPFFVEGQTPLFKVVNQEITVEGVAHGIGMGLRLDVMLLSGVLLLSTTPIEEFARSLQRMGLPSSLGFALSLAFRWVPTLLGSIGTVIQAQRSRGLDLTSQSVWGKIRRYPALVVPLIGHTLRQTNLLAMALESKGFAPSRSRHPYTLSKMTKRDYGVILLIVLLVVGSIWFRWQGYGTI